MKFFNAQGGAGLLLTLAALLESVAKSRIFYHDPDHVYAYDQDQHNREHVQKYDHDHHNCDDNHHNCDDDHHLCQVASVHEGIGDNCHGKLLRRLGSIIIIFVVIVITFNTIMNVFITIISWEARWRFPPKADKPCSFLFELALKLGWFFLKSRLKFSITKDSNANKRR